MNSPGKYTLELYTVVQSNGKYIETYSHSITYRTRNELNEGIALMKKTNFNLVWHGARANGRGKVKGHYRKVGYGYGE